MIWTGMDMMLRGSKNCDIQRSGGWRLIAIAIAAQFSRNGFCSAFVPNVIEYAIGALFGVFPKVL